MVCTTWVCARENCAPAHRHDEKGQKSHFTSYLFWRASRTHTHTYSARQSIFLINEMLFGYLIANLAQKLSKIELIENHKKLKISKILNMNVFI